MLCRSALFTMATQPPEPRAVRLLAACVHLLTEAASWCKKQKSIRRNKKQNVCELQNPNQEWTVLCCRLIFSNSIYDKLLTLQEWSLQHVGFSLPQFPLSIRSSWFLWPQIRDVREDFTEVEEILSSSLFLVVGTPNSIETVHMCHVFNEAVGSSFFLTPESVLIVRLRHRHQSPACCLHRLG